MDQVLLHHLPLCFGQQLSTVVACVVYMCAKLLQAPLTFDTITKVRRAVAVYCCRRWSCCAYFVLGARITCMTGFVAGC